MPELPEVESIRLTLAKNTLGKKIIHIKILWSSAAISIPGYEFAELLKGKFIENFDRRGKYLLIGLSNGITMIVHFRMTGRLIYYPEIHPLDKHTHAVFCLDEGELHYSDIRKFGRIQLVPTAKAGEVASLVKLGPEPLDEAFSFDQLGQSLSKKKGTIKAALLDQTVIAGLGNIYADEALFRAGILPERNTRSLKVSEIILLYNSIYEILREGIDARGTSFRDYRDAEGNRGSFQESLMVYGRGGQECKGCGNPLERKKIAGRTTVFCLHCQR
ncbi:MAG: Formamidopyrimidine-DNA glycosylase [Candidatus Dichloromethanomonas elyunquensis]|nr:MAG: Formamidopyrimidine-DNA glycosylase [Candidatus Dichloromethanomonas elyunquensis]